MSCVLPQRGAAGASALSCRRFLLGPRSRSWQATDRRAFSWAQSLNQIEKAYGQNNSILDNCHVRVAFAANDERTAKRLSDALGIATELRATKNYAGHRLSPWLGHLMVSRQETTRPLLTAGEVMQLPPSDEPVLVSGTRRSCEEGAICLKLNAI